MLLFKEKINYKHQGNGFQAHLDAPAYDHIRLIEHITANIAIDAATPENGCLEVVRGSHKMKVEFAEAGRITPEWENTHERTSVPLEMGDMLIFGSHLAHRSAENKTEGVGPAFMLPFTRGVTGRILGSNITSIGWRCSHLSTVSYSLNV